MKVKYPLQFVFVAVLYSLAVSGAMAQEPGSMSPNQAIAIVSESLPAGVTISTATPAQIQGAVYSATRTNPAAAGTIAGAVSAAVPSQAAAVSQGASSAVGDAAAAGDVPAAAATALSSSITTAVAPAAAGGASAPAPSFVPSATAVPTVTTAPGAGGTTTAVQSGG